jgi:hypothetical protein
MERACGRRKAKRNPTYASVRFVMAKGKDAKKEKKKPKKDNAPKPK